MLYHTTNIVTNNKVTMLFIIVILLYNLLSCNNTTDELPEIKNPFEQNSRIFNGVATDDEHYIYFTAVDLLFIKPLSGEEPPRTGLFIIDKSTNEMISTGLEVSHLALNNGFLYYSMNQDICRIETANLLDNINSRNYESEVITNGNWLVRMYNFFGKRINYIPYFPGLASSDLNGCDIVCNTGDFLCGYDNDTYYHIKLFFDNSEIFDELTDQIDECVLLSEKEGVMKEVLSLEDIVVQNNYVPMEYKRNFFVYNGYLYYVYGNTLKRQALKSNTKAEMIYQSENHFNIDDLLGILPSGIYLRQNIENNVILCINPNSGLVRQCLDRYDENTIYFISNLDNELYRIDIIIDDMKAYAIKISGNYED